MSQLDDIKEQMKAGWQNLMQKVQENPSYVQFQDRYQTLSPSSQKMVRLLAALTFILILVFYPMSLVFTSQESITAFEEKRNLIRDLFKTYREASAQPNIPTPPSVESLKASINSIITTADLTDEQKGGVIEAATEGKLIPANLVSHVINVSLSKLNIRQIVDIGINIVGISESVKMKDMTITANPTDTRYFDVTYKLYSLNVPEPTPEPLPEIDKPSKKKKETTKASDE